MFDYKGSWALITGASSGIGAAFAKELAKRGTNLILVARREDRLRRLCSQLEADYHIQCRVIAMDLAPLDASRQLFDEVKKQKLSVNILVNNAGIGVFGKLDETELEQNLQLIQINIITLTALTQLFLPDMLKEHKGVIINVASTAAFQALPYMSVYGASKAYVLSFTESLWAEYQKQGIQALALCPGPVATEFFHAMGSEINTLGKKEMPDIVARSALNAINKNKVYVIPGAKKNYILANVSRFVPRKIALLITEKIMRPK